MSQHKTAVFSNGHTDTYKGHRDVKAAWMITKADTGEVFASGHSLDAIKAQKTAAGNIPRPHRLPSGWRMMRNTVAMYQYAAKQGYRTPSEMAADYAAKNAEYAKSYHIEVVDL